MSQQYQQKPSLLSRLSLWWIGDIVRKGFKKVLQPDDLWQVYEEDDPKNASKQFMELYDKYKNRSWPLFRTSVNFAKRDLILSIVYYVIFVVLRFAGPFLLQKVVGFLQEDPKVTPEWHAYLFAFGLFLSQIISTFCQTKSNFLGFSVGLRIKNALVGITFRHTLDLSNNGRQKTTHGQVINLVSTDSQVVVEFMRFINQFWSAPLVLFAGIAYIYALIGWAVFAGLGIMVLFVPLSMKMGQIQTKIQQQKMEATDKRVKYTNEALQGIKVLKLYAWEDAMQDRLDGVRNVELSKLRKLQYYKAITLPIAIAIPNIASVITFVAYVLNGNELDPAEAFAVVSLFVIIRAPFVTFPIAITMISRIIVSFKRFKTFLTLPVHHDDASNNTSDSNNNAVEIQNATFCWEEDNNSSEEQSTTAVSVKKSENALNPGNDTSESSTDSAAESASKSLSSINLTVQKGELIAVCGKVASGKSSLCSAILGEMTRIEGKSKINGSVAYCSQEPFIQNATVRDNILFGTPFDEKRYWSTVKACALVSDFKLLPAGDATEIGERGINLSGGQKARISLARAVYSDADVYILDDPLSAVDAHVGKFIFERCIGNNANSALRTKTRILVTNNLHILHATRNTLKPNEGHDGVDRIVTMDYCKITQVGHYNELMQDSDGVLVQLMKHMGSVANDAEEVASVGEQDEALVDIELSPLENDEREASTEISVALKNQQEEKGKLTQKEMQASGEMKMEVYKSYFYAGTNQSIILVFLLLSSFLLAEAAFLSIDAWLAVWSDSKDSSENQYYMNIYVLLTFVFIFLILCRSFGFAVFGVKASKVLHERLLHRVFRLPMPFFWKTPMGRILNRLTRDVNDIDVMLPQSWQWFFMTLSRVFGVLILIIQAAPVFAFFLVPMIILYFLIREYYRRTARELQRIESVQRSPVFNHLGETLIGASTIRAYRRILKWVEMADYLQTQNHRAKYAVEATQIWLSQNLEFLGALVVFLCSVSIVYMSDSVAPGIAGLAIAYSLNIVINLNMSVRMATQVEAQMNCVERIGEYVNVPIEDDTYGEDTKSDVKPNATRPESQKSTTMVGKTWPQAGALEFKDVFFRYNATLDPALCGLSFRINPGELVGLVGRTGAGKSSIMVAIFRLVEIYKGQIQIDGVDLSTISRYKLRSSITMIPQDPVLFIGTIRYNLDPFNQYSDEEIWTAIDRAHLRETVESMPKKLEEEVTENGENISVGERALICLGRALLRRSKLVLLDEATAAVDASTDALIQHTIRSEFNDSTCLVIAHRLNTVIDSDKVLVLGEGKLLEYDTPKALLSKPDGEFRKLVEETGAENAAKLMAAAK